MNKNLYRIVFNARRGMRMAVAETASAQGKPASGNSQGPNDSYSNQPLALIDIARAAIKPIALALSLLALTPWAAAQILADGSAPGNQQPTILQTASGVTQVNIQAPSAAGVSRNTYSQFDVNRQGVVLNNSRTDSNTQIAGYVQGNPWLGGSGARVILNEVNSSNASQIRGYVEVAGQRAEVIIANPAGIAVNGGGFINASAVTLTTGAPVMNAGNLESFQVRSGSVVVDGDGLDTRTADYTNILARAAQINAGIWAKDIKVVSGANDISASNAATPTATATPGAGTGPTPAFALDVAAVGGMYAQKITLVGTESGLGVRNGGVIGATAGDVTVNSQGWLSNSGTLSAVGSTRIQTQGDVTNTGEIVATDTTRVDTATTLRNQGLIDSGNAAGTSQTQLKATTVDNVGAARIYGDTVSLAATTLNNDIDISSSSTTAATLASRQSLNIGVGTLNNSNGANILSLGDMAIGGSLDADGKATGSATTLTNSASTIEAQGTLQIHSASINNLNPVLEWEKDAGTAGVSGTVYFTTGGTFESRDGAVLATGDPLVAMAHGGYAYQNTTYVTCGSMGEFSSCGSDPNALVPVVTYTQGAAKANSGSGAYSFGGFASYVQTDYQAVVTKSTPGRIASGSDMTLVATTGVVNDQSVIISGGALTITSPSVDNRARTIQLDSVRNGTSYNWAQYDEGCGNIKGCNYNYQAYRDGTYASAVASTQVLDTSVRQAASTTPLNSAGETLPASTGNNLPNSSLLRIQSDPSAPVLVQTDPRFTNYRSWLSSDYITSRVSLDPSVTQKRLGDGFYEQRLINEQVAQLTGKRFLGNYTSDQQQYQALMDSGLTFAQTYNLRPGIALTAEQMAVLTTDIVWLQQETVTLPDGTTTQALVPHVYAAVRAGDLNAQGGLLSGNTVAINSTGEVRNGGTILGRTVLEINANTINNLGGQIAANDVKLTASQDINVVGGSVTGQNSLTALAGNDINVVSTTGSTAGGSGNYTYSRTGLDRMAGLYVAGPGTLLANLSVVAGNDLNIIGATVQGAGDTRLSAGNTVNLGTLQASQSNNFGAGDAKNHLLTSQTSDVGSTVTAGQNLTITAGQNVIAKAADLKAQGDVNIAAQGTVLLNAGQTRSSYDSVLSKSSSDLISTTTTRTQTQASAATAQVSSVQGQNVNIVAGKDLISVGTQFKGTDSLRVEGQDTSTFYAATDVHQISTTTHTKTDLGAAFSAMLDPLGLGTPIEEKTVTDARATSTSIGTALLSDKKIEIGVGNKTELQGANVEAQQIAFNLTDPNKAGVLLLGGSTDTTQTSHTEKSETMGLYQEMKGKGSTTETLNQTQLKGNVSFDNALKITVQIPDTKGGQELKSQINALVEQSNGVGLEYLNQLAADPNIQWDQIALANEKWSYDQAGLTPAGAALVSIAMAVVTGPGAASFASGLTTSGAMSAAMAAGMTSLASQAAVALINNQGDIGKTLDQLGSEESIKGLLTTMVTAGALDKLNSTMGWQDISPKTADFASNFGKSMANNFASAGINSALTGSSLEDGLQAALLNSVVSTSMAFGAKAIGTMTIPDANGNFTLNPAGQALAHALLGCVSGAATAGNGSGCTPGAAGALVGELAAKWYDPTGDKTDAEVLNFVKVVSATAGALTGDGSAQSVNTAAATGVNAVQNNFLGTRDIKNAVDKLKNCTVACDALRRVLVGDSAQQNVGRVQDQCKADPQGCSSRVQDMAAAVTDLQNPEVRATLGAATTDRLIQRQVSDLGRAVESLQWGTDHIASSQLIVRTALTVGATAAGAGILVNVARTVVVACSSGALTPACTGMLTELGIGASEAISGVPTLGLTAPTAALAASRLKALIPTNDTAAIAKELQMLSAQVKAEQVAANQTVKVGANGGTGSVIAADAAGGAKNPLLADAVPRNGDRLVLNQGNVPTCGANSCGMALDTMGRPVDVATLIQRIPPSAEGIYSTDVATLMKSQGVDAIALGRRNVSDLARYTENGTPVVVRVADPGVSDFSHFVVVDGVTTRNGVQVVAIRDPQGAQYFSPVTTFNKSFTGEVIVPKPATTPVPPRK
jgi:filamentous hemagglutinin family protein